MRIAAVCPMAPLTRTPVVIALEATPAASPAIVAACLAVSWWQTSVAYVEVTEQPVLIALEPSAAMLTETAVGPVMMIPPTTTRPVVRTVKVLGEEVQPWTTVASATRTL